MLKHPFNCFWQQPSVLDLRRYISRGSCPRPPGVHPFQPTRTNHCSVITFRYNSVIQPLLMVRSSRSGSHPLRGPRDQTSQQPPRHLVIFHVIWRLIIVSQPLINVYPYLSSWSWHYNAANNEETLTDWWGTVLASSSAKVRTYRLTRSGGSLIARLLSDGVQKNQQLLNLPWVSDSSYSIFLVFQIWFTMNAERVTRKIDTPKTSLVLMGRPTIMSIDDRFCSRSIWSHYIGRVTCRFQSTSRRSVQNNNCGESLKHPVLIWSKRSWCGGRIIMTWHFHCSKKPNTPRNWQTSRLPTYIFKYQVRWQTRVTSKTISKELTPRHRWTCFQHMPRYEVNRLSKDICHNNHSRQQILRSQPNLIN